MSAYDVSVVLQHHLLVEQSGVLQLGVSLHVSQQIAQVDLLAVVLVLPRLLQVPTRVDVQVEGAVELRAVGSVKQLPDALLAATVSLFGSGAREHAQSVQGVLLLKVPHLHLLVLLELILELLRLRIEWLLLLPFLASLDDHVAISVLACGY